MQISLVLLTFSVLLGLLGSVFSYRVIGYFPNWAQYRSGSCQYVPEDINPFLYTHINYAFAYIDGSTYELIPTEWNDQSTDWSEGMYARVQDLKKRNPNLKTLLSVGGWNFNYYSSTSWIFSAVSATSSSRQTFVKNALQYITQWGFDGIDIDWEYPADPAQGGTPADKDNYSLLLKEFRSQITSNYGGKLLLTTAMAASQSTWEAAYNLAEIQNYVDWFNLMTYDLHGSWDGYTASHTAMDSTRDQYTIKHAVSGYINAGVPSSKISLGLAIYGHTYSFTSSSSCPGYYTSTNGGGPAGACTQASGMLAYYEIVSLLGSAVQEFDYTSLTPYICYNTYGTTPEKPLIESYRDPRNHYKHSNSTKSAVNLANDGSNASGSWACYDDQQSLSYKISYIKSMGLGGAMMWSIDMDYNDQLMTYVWNSLQ